MHSRRRKNHGFGTDAALANHGHTASPTAAIIARMTTHAPALAPLDALRQRGFDVVLVSHAQSILAGDFPGVLDELVRVLLGCQIPISEIIGGGGGETKFTQRLRNALARLGWAKHNFEIAKTIDGSPRESTSHEVDHVKRVAGVGVIGCEIEWNNKDPFFDRDLENYKRLHAEGAISVGIIITRGSSLQNELWNLVRRFASERGIIDMDTLAASGVAPTPKQRANILRRVQRAHDPVPFADAWTDNFVSNKFGQATTHWAKLMSRVDRGVGNPCPLLLLGLPASIVQFDTAAVEQMDDDAADAAM